MPVTTFEPGQIKPLLDYLSPIASGVENAHKAFVSLHPDYFGKALDAHPNNVDIWLGSNRDGFNWVLQAYTLLIKARESQLIQVKPGGDQGYLTIVEVRKWIKEPSKYNVEIQSHPWEIIHFFAQELEALAVKNEVDALRAAQYRQQHPPDTTFFQALKPVTAELAKVAPYVQIVVSFVPGIGTIASVALGATVAALQGKSLLEIVESAGESAVPGGPLVVESAKGVVNIAKAAAGGQNILKATGNAVYSAALQYIDDPNLRAVADKAIKSVVSGQNVLSATENAILQTAISRIPDKNAQALVNDAVHGRVNPKSVLAAVANSDIAKSTLGPSLVAATKTIGNANSLAANARDEIVASASNFVNDKGARETIARVTSKVLSGKQTTASEVQAAQQALNTVREPAARKVLETIINGKSDPKTVFQNTDGSLIQVLVKTDLDSNVSKLLMADASTLPSATRDGPVMASDVIPGTLRDASGKTTKGKFMQLVGTGRPVLQFQPEGSKNWLVGFWFRVQ